MRTVVRPSIMVDADLNANFEKMDDNLTDFKDLNSNHFWTIDEEQAESEYSDEFGDGESAVSNVSMRDFEESDSADSEGTLKEPEVLENALRWEDYFGSSVDLAPDLLDIYDRYNADSHQSSPTRTVPASKDVRQASTRRSPVERKMTEQKKRPLSISSLSSSSSSTTSLHRPTPKKLAVAVVSSNSDYSPSSNADNTDADLATDDELLNSDLHPLAEEEHYSPSLNASRSTLNASTPLSASRSTLNSTTDHRPVSRSGSDEGRSVLDRVVEEIMVTERTYVTDMLDIIQGYLDHIVDQPTLIMSTSEIEQLFGNIREIYAFNRELLAKLEECGADPVLISQCFVEHNDGFIIYTQYCTNYPNSMATLTRCMRQSDLAELFKQRQIALRQPLPLGSYLLKPVQRILKYHLLMQNMLDNSTSFTGESGRIIRQAYDGMTRIANHINEMKRKHEHMVRIQEIQSLLCQWDGEDLTTYGELLMEDSFRLCGAKSHRHLFLFNKALLITKKRDDGAYTCKCSIMCSNLMLVESIQNEPLSFHVIPFDNPKLQVTLQAKNLDHKRKWCHEMKRLIIENYNAVIPEKARNLVMNLGAHNDSVDNENTDPSKRHAAPEYLDRRRTRRKSAGFIPDLNSLMRSQRGRKSNRKSEVYISSPKSSPPMSRKYSLGDIGRINMQEIIQTSMEFDRSRRGQPNGRRPRPRSRSFDCGETLDIRRSLSETGDHFTRHDEKRTSLPRDQRLETPTSRLGELSKRYSFKIATKLNRVDSTTVREKKRRAKKNDSIESMDLDSDTEGEYLNHKKNMRNGASDPYLSLDILRRAKDAILRRRPDEQRESGGRCQDAVSADDTADTDSICSNFSDVKSTGSNTSLLSGAYDNLTFGRAYDARMKSLASDEDLISADEAKRITVNRSNSFNGRNGVRNTNRFYGRYSADSYRPQSPYRTLSSPAPDKGPNHALIARSVSAENSPLRLPDRSRTIGSISSVESECSTPRSNSEICWTDLEEYIANDTETLKRRLPKFPVLEIDLEPGQEMDPVSEMSVSTDCLNGTLKPRREPRRSSPLRRKTYNDAGSETEDDEEKEEEMERRKKHVYELTRAYSAKMKLEKSREIARELNEAGPVLNKVEPKRSPRFRKQNRDIILGGVSQPVSRQTSKETSPDRHIEPASDSESLGMDTGEEFIRGLESLVASENSMNTSMAESTADSIEPSTDETPSEPGDDISPKGSNIRDTIRRLERRNTDSNALKLTLTRRGKGSIVSERVRSLERCSTSPRTMRKYTDIYRDKYLSEKDSSKGRADKPRGRQMSRVEHVRCHSESEILECHAEKTEDLVNGAAETVEVAENLRGYVKHVITQFQQQ